MRCNAKNAIQANRHPCTVSIPRKSRISLMIRFLQLKIRECFELAGFFKQITTGSEVYFLIAKGLPHKGQPFVVYFST